MLILSLCIHLISCAVMDVVETISLWLEQYSGLIAILSGIGLLTLLSSVMNKPKASEPSVSSSRMADVKASIKKQDSTPAAANNQADKDVDIQTPKVLDTTSEPLSNEAAETPAKPKLAPLDLVIMHVVAKDANEPFKGYALIQAFAQNGLHASENNHFQRFSTPKGEGALWFHVASMRHPGVFDLSDPGMMSCPGLVLILDCKQVDDVLGAYDAMLDTAHRLAAELDGNLLDDAKQSLVTATTQKWRAQLENQSAVAVAEAE